MKINKMKWKERIILTILGAAITLILFIVFDIQLYKSKGRSNFQNSNGSFILTTLRKVDPVTESVENLYANSKLVALNLSIQHQPESTIFQKRANSNHGGSYSKSSSAPRDNFKDLEELTKSRASGLMNLGVGAMGNNPTLAEMFKIDLR